MKTSPPQRLTPVEEDILRPLAKSSTYGLDLVRRSGETISRGTAYGYLASLTRRGYLTVKAAEQRDGAIGPVRKIYTITDLGHLILRAMDAANEAYAKVWNERPKGETD